MSDTPLQISIKNIVPNRRMVTPRYPLCRLIAKIDRYRNLGGTLIHTLHALCEPEDPSRRQWLQGAAAATAAVGAIAVGATATAATAAPATAATTTPATAAPPAEGIVQFANARDRFRALFRFERDWRDEGTALSCYQFLMYALPDGERPQPVVRFEGMEFSYFRRVADDVWRIHAHNVSYPRDLTSGAFVTQVANPFGGPALDVTPMKLLGDPGVLHGPRGYLPLDAPAVRWLDTHFVVRYEDDLVKAEHIRPTPDGWPKQFIESSVSSVARKDFDDPRVTSLRYQTSGFYVFPFPKWMNMAGREGHMLGAWSGRKLAGPERLPREFAARLARENPELLRPRWQEFDRPIRPELARWTDA